MVHPSFAAQPGGLPGTRQPTSQSRCCWLSGNLLLQVHAPVRQSARTPCSAARRALVQQGSQVNQTQACGCHRASNAFAPALPSRVRRRRTRATPSAAATAVEHSVAAASLVDAAVALAARMADDGGLPAQSARPSDVPSDMGGTTLGFVCSRDVSAGEVQQFLAGPTASVIQGALARDTPLMRRMLVPAEVRQAPCLLTGHHLLIAKYLEKLFSCYDTSSYGDSLAVSGSRLGLLLS